MDLLNKNVLITGAAKRLGRAIALDLAEKGANIILHYHESQQEAALTIAEIEKIYEQYFPSNQVVSFKADLSSSNQLDELLRFVMENVGKIDILINNASSFIKMSLEEITPQLWDNIINTNLKSIFFLSQGMKRMINNEKGVIINFSDLSSEKYWDNFLLHGLSKSGVLYLTQYLAKNLAPSIRVNAIIPGLILPPEEYDLSKWNEMIEKVPMKQTGDRKTITNTIHYLIENDFITGSIIHVDGGEHLNA
ncbi:MAG: SDR family oxidoreductase [Candidatus Heimdallarchaeota archaeon]|nr:SDR family oxidoreductase [Candidatus Heimdallarchaeota archaeon]